MSSRGGFVGAPEAPVGAHASEAGAPEEQAAPQTPVPVAWPGFPDAARPAAESPRRRAVIRALALVALAVTIAYLVWRTAYTIAGASPVLAVALLLLELHALASLGFFTVDLWDIDAEVALEPGADGARTVAVLIPTYNEPREVLLPTIAAAVALTPAHETWVLDDGDRPWVAELATELGARYRTRPDHAHAKAGNVNAALTELDVDLVAVFDADHVAHHDFLVNVLGYFDDPSVALVQTPQDFYNLSSFEHVHRRGGRRYGEQELFYRGLAAGRNRWGAAFWCGTNAVVRVSALREVGGVATETVTEDIHTTIRLHRKGYRTVYHNEVLARGLAASNAAQYLAQRLRWGTGAMQVLRVENPAVVSGLRPMQRLSYLSTLLGWFDSWRTLGYVVLPIATVATGWMPVAAPWRTFLAWFAVTFLLQRVALTVLSRGRAPLTLATVFEFVRLPANLQATMALFTRRPRRFTVTDKGRSTSDRRRMPVPGLLVALIVASLAAFAWYVATVAGLTPVHYRVPWVAHGAAVWLAVNLAFVVVAARRIHDERFGPDRRAAVRFQLDGSVVVGEHDCRLTDVSLTGLRVSAPSGAFTPGEQVRVVLAVAETVLDLGARVRSVRKGEHDWRELVGLELVGIGASDQAVLALALFRTGITPSIVGVPRPSDEPVLETA